MGLIVPALCVCLVMAALFSESFIAAHAEHDCSGEGCPVCLLILRAENFSRHFKSAVFQSGFSAKTLWTAAVILRLSVFYFIPKSSVGLKVKMNN
jgi:hypothetical protein